MCCRSYTSLINLWVWIHSRGFLCIPFLQSTQCVRLLDPKVPGVSTFQKEKRQARPHFENRSNRLFGNHTWRTDIQRYSMWHFFCGDRVPLTSVSLITVEGNLQELKFLYEMRTSCIEHRRHGTSVEYCSVTEVLKTCRT